MGQTSGSRISHTFAALRERRRIGLMPFIAAGYPDLATTAAVLPALEAGGASLIEIGIPFSDPVADGPVIQQAFTDALSKKLKLADIFRTIAEVRPKLSIPIVAMVSYSIVYRYGVDRFIASSKSAGFDGLIIPDLPPPEAGAICPKIRSAGLDSILLIAPTTPEQRRREIVALSSGFVYYLSVSGITGERTQLPQDIASHVQSIRDLTSLPIGVGFGINTPEQVKQLQTIADGAIVGSAVVRRMQKHAAEGPAAIAHALQTYCQELLSLVK